MDEHELAELRAMSNLLKEWIQSMGDGKNKLYPTALKTMGQRDFSGYSEETLKESLDALNSINCNGPLVLVRKAIQAAYDKHQENKPPLPVHPGALLRKLAALKPSDSTPDK